MDAVRRTKFVRTWNGAQRALTRSKQRLVEELLLML